MTISKAVAGEDVPITIDFEDGAGNAVDPDDTDADGNPDAEVTVVDTSDDTELLSSVAMSYVETGSFEHVWDTDVDANGPEEYRISISAEFSSETKISRDTIQLT